MSDCKISFLGDFMTEPGLLEQAKTECGFDYKPVFEPLKNLLSESDYLVGNLETPVAGAEAGYSDSLFSFNAPDEFVAALKYLGMNMMSTANNHMLDRGFNGLVRTLTVLDDYGISHTGTYSDNNDPRRIHYFSLGQCRVALIAYTYSTNYRLHHTALDKEHNRCVNYLKPYNAPSVSKHMKGPFDDVKAYVEELLGRTLSRHEITCLKAAMKVPIAYADDVFSQEEADEYLEYVRKDCITAKNNADIVIFYPHMGGQFNVKVGAFSEYIMNKSAEMGFDAIIGGHSHTTQRGEYIHNVPCFYSLGNVSQSPNSVYAVKETLPEYGLAVHLYVDKSKISKTAFSITKIVEDQNTPMRVFPVDELYDLLSDSREKELLEKDVRTIYTRITGKELTGSPICREYIF